MNEYEVTPDGIQLLGGLLWQDADHLNVRIEGGGTINFHAEAKCANLPTPAECTPIMQAAANRIGESFIPWSDLGIADGSCIEWVQFSRANYHYGEKGEDAFCLVPPPVDPPVKPAPLFRWVKGDPVIDCDGGTVTIVKHEESAGYYLGNDNEWHLGDYFPTGNEKTKSWQVLPEQCPIEENPPIDPPAEPETPVNTVPTKPVLVDTAAPALAETGAVDIVGTVLLGGAALVALGSFVLRKALRS